MKQAAAYSHSPVALCWTDPDSRIVAVNEQFTRLVARTAQELRGQLIANVIPIDADDVLRLDVDSTSSDYRPVEFRLPDRTQTYRLAAAAIRNARNAPGGLSLAIIDVTGQKRLEERLSQVDERVSFALESAGQWIWELNVATGFVWRSRGWKAILGFGEDEPLPNEHIAWEITHPDDRADARKALAAVLTGEQPRFEATYRVIHKNGGWRWILSRGKLVGGSSDSDPLRLLATSVDITAQKETEAALTAAIAERRKLERDLVEANRHLEMLTETDFLTALPNRRKFDKILREELRRARREKTALALVMIDVDFFKSYNDHYGHQAGDACLRAIADTLLATVRQPGTLISRYGGEEFAVILPGAGETLAFALAGELAIAISRKAIAHEGSPLGFVTLSAGVAAFTPEADPPEPMQSLVGRADHALYRAKALGRNRIETAV